MAMEWAAGDIGGRVPLAVTIAEATVPCQVEMARAAKAVGAGWIILQPPPVSGLPEAEYVRFFGAVAERTDLPVAVQNAAQYIGIGLSVDGLVALNRNHPNRSEEHTSELQSLMRISYAVFCLKKKNTKT